MRYVTLALVLTLLASPCAASSLFADYDFVAAEWRFGVGLEYPLSDTFAVGTTLTTLCPDYGFKGIVPSWIPSLQGYEVWAEVRWQDVRLRLTDWCDHYLAQGGVGASEDRWGLRLSLRYDF